MEDRARDSIHYVITVMRERVGDPLSVSEMARLAMFSKFHFTRVFREATQVSPGRFFGLLRLAEAKRLLLTTSMTVADVSLAVGYASLGTFSSRFKESVGLAPSAYRTTGGVMPFGSPAPPRAAGGGARVAGRVSAPVDGAQVFLGLFREPVPEGVPARCTSVRAPGRFVLECVPVGQWYLLGYVLPVTGRDAPVCLVGLTGPIIVTAGAAVTAGDLRLREPCPFDPPVLTAPWEADLQEPVQLRA